MRKHRGQKGQAMLETVLFLVLVLLALIAGLKAAQKGYVERTDEMVDFYAFPFP